MKIGDKVSFLEWNSSLGNVKFDPNAKHGIGFIEEILFHYAGYELRIKSDDGRILDLHEFVHDIKVIES
jgi:hypothetical protein